MADYDIGYMASHIPRAPRPPRSGGRGGSGSYVVLPGESWASIAGKIYGNQRMLGELQRANSHKFYLRPGDELRLPQAVENPYVSEYDLFRRPSPSHPGYNSMGEWSGGRQEWKGGKQTGIPGFLEDELWSDPEFLLSLGLPDDFDLTQLMGQDLSPEEFAVMLENAGVTPAPLPEGIATAEEAVEAGHPPAVSWATGETSGNDALIAILAMRQAEWHAKQQYDLAMTDYNSYLEQFGGREFIQAQEQVYLLEQRLADARASGSVHLMGLLLDALASAERKLDEVAPTVMIERAVGPPGGGGPGGIVQEEVPITQLDYSELRQEVHDIPGFGGTNLKIAPASSGEQALDIINQIFGEYFVGMIPGGFEGHEEDRRTISVLAHAAQTVRAGVPLLFWNIVGSGPQVSVYKDLYEQGIIEKVPKSEQGTPENPNDNEIWLPYPDKARLWYDAQKDMLQESWNIWNWTQEPPDDENPLPDYEYMINTIPNFAPLNFGVTGPYIQPTLDSIEERAAARIALQQEVSHNRSQAYLLLEEFQHLQRQVLLTGDPSILEEGEEVFDEAKRLLTEALNNDQYVRGSISDPYFAGTWVNQELRKKAFFEALVAFEMIQGRPLTDTEIRRIKERFTDPVTEVGLQIFLDPTNWLPIDFIRPVLEGGKKAVKTIAELTGIILDDLGESMLRVGGELVAKEGVIQKVGNALLSTHGAVNWGLDLFRTLSVTSAANTLRNQLLDGFNMLTYPLRNDNGETVLEMVTTLRDVIIPLAKATDLTPEMLADAVEKFARMDLPWTFKGPAAGRYIQWLVNAAKIGDPQSAIAAVKAIIPEKWPTLIEDITQRIMKTNLDAAVGRLMELNPQKWAETATSHLGEVVEQTQANALKIARSMGSEAASNREISIQFADAIRNGFMRQKVHAGTGLFEQGFLYKILSNIEHGGIAWIEYPQVQKAVSTYLTGFNKLWDMWVASVLTIYPRWAFRNLVDSTFRVVVDGGGLWDSIRSLAWVEASFDPALRVAPIQETFVRSAMRAGGETVAERILAGEVSTLTPFWGNLKLMGQELRRLTPEGLNWLGRLKWMLTHPVGGLKTLVNSFTGGFVADYASGLEYVLRRRLFYTKFLDVFPNISGPALEASIRAFQEAGGGDDAILLARTIAERARYNPEAAAEMLKRLSGQAATGRKVYSLLIPPDLWERLAAVGWTGTERAGFVEAIAVRLEGVTQRAVQEGKKVVPWKWIDEVFRSTDELMDGLKLEAQAARDFAATRAIREEVGVPSHSADDLHGLVDEPEAMPGMEDLPPVEPGSDLPPVGEAVAVEELAPDVVEVHPPWLDNPIPVTRSTPSYLAAGEARKETYAKIYDELEAVIKPYEEKIVAGAKPEPDALDAYRRAVTVKQRLDLIREFDTRLHTFLFQHWPGPISIPTLEPLGTMTRSDAWDIGQAIGEMYYNRSGAYGEQITEAFRLGEDLPDAMTPLQMLEDWAGIRVQFNEDGSILRISQIERLHPDHPALYGTKSGERIEQFIYRIFGAGTDPKGMEELMTHPYTGRNWVSVVDEVPEEVVEKITIQSMEGPKEFTVEEATTRIEEIEERLAADTKADLEGPADDVRSAYEQGLDRDELAALNQALDEIPEAPPTPRVYFEGEILEDETMEEMWKYQFKGVYNPDDGWGFTYESAHWKASHAHGVGPDQANMEYVDRVGIGRDGVILNKMDPNVPNVDLELLGDPNACARAAQDLIEMGAPGDARVVVNLQGDPGYGLYTLEELAQRVGVTEVVEEGDIAAARLVTEQGDFIADLEAEAQLQHYKLRNEYWETVARSYNWGRYGADADTPEGLVTYFRNQLLKADAEAQPELYEFYQQQIEEIEYVMRIFDDHAGSLGGSAVQYPMPLRPLRPSRFEMPTYWQRATFQMEWTDQQLKGTREALDYWRSYLRTASETGESYLQVLPRSQMDLLKKNWLPDFVAGRQRAIDVSMYGSGEDIVPELGTKVEGALPATQDTMLDYQTYTALDQLIKDNIFPFWMFTSRSIPMWIDMVAEKPQLLGWWAKYLRFTDQIQYQDGAVTSRGEPLPSLRGAIPIPGTNFWIDPTQVLSLGFIMPWGKYRPYDQREDLNIVQQVSQWLMDAGRYLGAHQAPWLHLGQIALGALDENYAPPFSLISPMDLVPRWLQRSIQEQLARHHLPTLPWMWSREWPMQDFMVERRMLSWLLEELETNPEQATGNIALVKEALGYELTPAGEAAMAASGGPDALARPVAHNELFYTLNFREDNELWMRFLQEVEDDQRTGRMMGYWTGFYPKPYTDAELGVSGARRDINLIRDMINNQLGAMIFHLDPDPEARYEDYLNASYETPAGWVEQLAGAGRWLETANGEQAFGRERREMMAQNIHEDTVTQGYWDALRAASTWLQGQLNQLPVGAPSEDRAVIWEQYWQWREMIQTHPFFNEARRQSMIGKKPTSLIESSLREDWFYRIRETRPSYDPNMGYDEYQARILEWEEDLPQIAESLKWAFYIEAWDYATRGRGLTTGTFQAFLRGEYPVDDERFVEIGRLTDAFIAETDADTFAEWMKTKDTPMDALNEAWRTLYWDPYWTAVDGLSGAIRDEAELNFQESRPVPNGQELADWVMVNYPEREWTTDDLIALTDSGIMSVEDRFKPESQTAGMETQVWDILAMCGRDKEWLRRAVTAMGGDEDDFTRFYSNGAQAWRDPEEFATFVQMVAKAAEIKGLQPLTDRQVRELANAQRLNNIFRRVAEKQLGDDFYKNLNLYYELDTSQEKRAFRDVYPKIDEYWDLQEQFAGAYPLWALYYNERNYVEPTEPPGPAIVPGVPSPEGFASSVSPTLRSQLTNLARGRSSLDQPAIEYLLRLADRHPEWSVFIEMILRLNQNVSQQP